MNKTIIFHSGQVSERGTEVALFDYAHYNERLLGNRSICLFPKDRILSESVNRRFTERFLVRYYGSHGEWDGILRETGAKGFYSIRYGGGMGRAELPSAAPSFIHCVFDTRKPYGDVCAAISPYLNRKFHTRLPVLPHIVEKKSAATEDLRPSLGIPREAVVFGCYGGATSFSLPFAREAVRTAAARREDARFLFMNIEPFAAPPNVRFLAGSSDLDEKQRFINSCDAMLHARKDGETFGLAVAEFFISGKPVLTYRPRLDPRRRYDRAHLDILGGRGIVYRSRRELEELLTLYRGGAVAAADIAAAYLDPFSPRRAMDIFDELFASKL